MALSSTLNLSGARLDNGLDGMNAGEADLIARSKAGDVQAFNLLIERYERTVYAVCCRLLGDADAADATQETFLSAFRGIRGYRDGSFIAWLLRIARNECFDQLRARKRRPHVSLNDIATGTHAGGPATMRREVPDPGEAPDARVLRAELMGEIQHRLAELPADQRLAIILSDIEGYNHEEIAAVTGWRPGTVKSRLSRGRARLRDALRAGNVWAT